MRSLMLIAVVAVAACRPAAPALVCDTPEVRTLLLAANTDAMHESLLNSTVPSQDPLEEALRQRIVIQSLAVVDTMHFTIRRIRTDTADSTVATCQADLAYAAGTALQVDLYTVRHGSDGRLQVNAVPIS